MLLYWYLKNFAVLRIYSHAIFRDVSTKNVFLRFFCTQIGLSIRDLDLLTIGMVNEMFIESRNDEVADKAYHRIVVRSSLIIFKGDYWISNHP